MKLFGVPIGTFVVCVLAGVAGWALSAGAWTLIQDHTRTTIIWNLVNRPRPAAQVPPR